MATQIVSVGTADELAASAVGALVKLQAAGVPSTLVVELRPGMYRGVAVNLTDPASSGVVAITVRAAEPGTVVLSDVRLHLEGTDVRVEGLIFECTRRATPVVQARIATSLTLERVALVDHTPKDRRGAPLISVSCSYRTGAKAVTLRDSWIVGNREARPSAMIAARTVQPDVIETLEFERVAVVGNAYAVLMAPGFAREVSLDSCFVWASPGAGPMARIDTASSRWRSKDSVVVVDEVATAVAIASTKPVAELPPVALDGLWVRRDSVAPLPLAGVPLHTVPADAPDPTGAARVLARQLAPVDVTALATAAGLSP